MSHPLTSIPKLSGAVILAEHVSAMLEEFPKVSDSDIDSQSICIEDILAMQQKLVQELLVLQQVQDLALATQLGEV